MPAILRNVAKTDTLEIQRQKINLLAQDVYSIGSGGSDLSAGNIKLGDGTRTSPSLSFSSDNTLGIYKSSQKSIGYVVDGKKTIDITPSSFYSYKDLILQKRILQSSGVQITNSGSNYDVGVYNDINLIGGSGEGAQSTIVVEAFSGSITNNGVNYNPGSFSNIPLTGGTGSGALATFTVDGIQGSITNAGSGYFPGNYTSVPLSGGSGTNAVADIFITDAQGQSSSISGSITTPGSGYVDASYLNVPVLNTPTQTFVVTSISNPGTPPPSSVYAIDGNTQQSLTLIKGNTYRFDISDSSLSTHPFIFESSTGNPLSSLYYISVAVGTPGTSGSFIDLIIKPSAPTETIRYDCSVHNNMGANINIISGTAGNYGSGASANVTVSGNSVTAFSFANIGTGYKSSDILQLPKQNLGNSGSGFGYTISSVSLYGRVSAIFVTNIGQNYLLNDILSFNNSFVGLVGSGFQYTVSSRPGTIQNINFVNKGNNYSVNNILSFPTQVTGISTTLNSSSNTITVSSVTGIYTGFSVLQTAGSGVIGSNITVSAINSQTNTITLSANPFSSGSATLSFIPPYGNPTTPFAYTISDIGVIASASITNGGNGYFSGDLLTVNSTDVSQPITYGVTNKSVQILTFTQTISSSFFTTSDTISYNNGLTTVNANIYKVKTSGANLEYLIIDDILLTTGNQITKTGDATLYTVDTASTSKRFFLDTGSGSQYSPSLTLYSGNTYIFDLSNNSNNSHLFSFSQSPDGIHNTVSGLTCNFTNNSTTVAVSSTSGLYPGMSLSVTSGLAQLQFNTKIVSIDNLTTITISNNPITPGSAVVSFTGTEYTDGVTRSLTQLKIKILDTTPNLYYYCASTGSLHTDEGGENGQESLLTINLNNPRIFGSNFQLTVNQVNLQNVISSQVDTGLFTSTNISTTGLTTNTANILTSLTSPAISSSQITTSNILSSGILTISPSTVNFLGNTNFGSSVTVVSASGNLTTSGVLKTTNSLNINDKLLITDNTISSTTGNSVVISPAIGRVAKINSTSAITIPSGTTSQRPTSGIVESGSIRFNTDTGQYEGYSSSTSSWSSLGGVRDLDGNTYITAEASIGANDNTLYFYNDGNNSVRVSPSQFIFNTVKNISSPNPLNPPSTQWSANTPVSLGSYVFWNNNLYEVTTAGTTGTSGNEPTHTTGVQTNGTAQLTWYAYYSDDITFNQVSNVKIVNNVLLYNESSSVYDLKLSSNKISTNLSDIIIEPFSGKKVDINTNTSLVLPNGTTAERGIPGQGSVRFNTSLSQFEGYNGINWTSLGGVRDVDGNTYIIPETSPGANENILYFYNNGNNTLRLSTTELTFNTIDQIGSSTNNLDLQASTVTFNNLSLTLDTSSLSTNRLLSTKTNFDIALSSGLTTDSLVRLTNDGDIYINKSFGTGSDNLIKVLDNELNKFELDDIIIESSEYTLTKGTTNSGASVIFNPTLHSGAKIVLIADNTTLNDREMIEFTVISKGTDIFHTEYGNVVSNGDIITPTFDFDASNNVRLNTALVSGVATGNVVNVTVISTVIKK